MEWRILLFALIWPSIAFIDAIIYWLIRKRIGDRKLIWAHMLFSLFALVLLWVVYFFVFLIIDGFNNGKGWGGYLQKMQTIKLYTFVFSIVIGHVLFIVAIVRSLSIKKLLLTNDVNDLLREVADPEH
jgi:bacteriorhodopsin